MHFATDFEKQKVICGFCCWGTAADARADAVFGDGPPRERPVVRRGDHDREARQAGALPLW
jgi:hypothetical protein